MLSELRSFYSTRKDHVWLHSKTPYFSAIILSSFALKTIWTLLSGIDLPLHKLIYQSLLRQVSNVRYPVCWLSKMARELETFSQSTLPKIRYSLYFSAHIFDSFSVLNSINFDQFMSQDGVVFCCDKSFYTYKPN
jgi:hypothetical protein